MNTTPAPIEPTKPVCQCTTNGKLLSSAGCPIHEGVPSTRAEPTKPHSNSPEIESFGNGEPTKPKTCNAHVYWWDGEYEGDCELLEGHTGPHYDGISWFNDDNEEVDAPTAVHGTGVKPTEHSAQSCNFFACHAGGDPCPFVANPKYRPEPTNTDAELADIVHRIFQRGVQAEREARGDFNIKDGGPEFAKQAYVQQLQAHADARVAEARIDELAKTDQAYQWGSIVTYEGFKKWRRNRLAQLAPPNYKEK